MPSVTPFQQAVYDATRRIPKGRVATYALVAKMIGCHSPRAVGQALRRNPFAPEVPCHRVVASDLSLCGFAGHTEGPEFLRKRILLESEGVQFDARARVLASHLYVSGRP
jgi:methylated-DNA-[protein]-cysteine S-methyltransferase